MLRKILLSIAVTSAFAITAITGIAQDVQVPADKANFHIFILMGASNMAGTGTPVLHEYIKPDPKVLFLASGMKWTNSVVYYGAGMNPGQVFARHYAELYPDVTVGLVQCAKASMSLKEIEKGAPDSEVASNYDVTLAKIKGAMSSGTLKAILWHQGEINSSDPKYVDSLKVLVKNLRTDLKQPDLPFIVGELGRFDKSFTKFNELLSSAKTAIPLCAVASSEGLMDLGDKMNFSGCSVEVLGSRYLMEYLKLMKEKDLIATFKPTLDEITKKMLAKDAEWETIPNPAMTEGDTRPYGWDGKWMSRGSIDVIKDNVVFTSPPSSLKIESTTGPVSGSISQTLRNVAGKKIKISFKVTNSGFSSFVLSLTGMDSSMKQVFQKNLLSARRADDWTPYSIDVFVPTASVNTRLLINVSGDGRIWFDDFAIEKEAPPPGAELVANSTMTEGYDKPLEWTGIWTSEGSLKVSKDSKVFKSPPASLKIISDGGPVNGSVSQELKDVAGKKVRVKGWIKVTGLSKCSVGVGSFDSSWKMLKWGSIYYKELADGEEVDWVAFDKVVDVSPDAEKVNLSLGITGEGSAWFDDIEVGESKPAPKTPAPAK